MLERIDILVKWFLRIIVGIYLLMLALIITITPFTQGLEATLFNTMIWVFIMPFGLDVRMYSGIENLSAFWTYGFWTFWVVTVTRWITTGKHFWQ